MAARTATDDEEVRRSECWCCARIDTPDNMVHLGNHPEVAICTRCAHSVSKWASEIEDQSRGGLAVRARDVFRNLRRTAIQHGWQHNRLIGPPLRWIGKHTP